MIMRTYTVGDLKTNFSQILDLVRSGERVAIAYGKQKKVVAYLVPNVTELSHKRPLGLLAGEAKAVFMDNFKMTEAEFLGL